MASLDHSVRSLATRRRTLAAGLASAACLALPSAASAAKPSFTVISHFPNHAPIANKDWKLTLDVHRGKQRLSGSVRYAFEFAGAVVSRQPGHGFKKGVYRDTMRFPSSAVGEPLTLVVIVKTRYGTRNIYWQVNTKQ